MFLASFIIPMSLTRKTREEKLKNKVFPHLHSLITNCAKFAIEWKVFGEEIGGEKLEKQTTRKKEDWKSSLGRKLKDIRIIWKVDWEQVNEMKI